jgi:pre-rRNA-processing protein TSR4
MNTESGLKPSIKLGFVETIEEPLMPSDFPSKVGGKPVWLVPEYLPLSEEMLCGVCQTPLSFLLQIYAPFDIPEAYHRTIYVFCCKNGACHRKPTQSFKVLRAQLPKDNRYYGITKSIVSPKELVRASLCDLCGQFGDKRCSQCKAVRYCSVQHQKEDWVYGGHKEFCKSFVATNTTSKSQVNYTQQQSATPHKTNTKNVLLPSLFLEFELVIEDEPPGEPPDFIISDNITSQKVNELYQRYRTEWECHSNDINSLDDEHNTLERVDNEAKQNVDKVFKNFKKTISKEPEQVLRYTSWKDSEEPLWAYQKNIPISEQIPQCSQCGSKRVFEFQILPQLLYYLKVGDTMDWGTLVVYTCPRSCTGKEPGYYSEFLWRQPADDE